MWNTWIILNFNQLRMLEMRSLSLIFPFPGFDWAKTFGVLNNFFAEPKSLLAHACLFVTWIWSRPFPVTYVWWRPCRWEIGIGVSNLQKLLPWRYYTNFRKYTHMGNRLKWKRMENSKISLLTLHLFGEINISRKLKIIIRIGKYDIFSTLGGTVML